MPAELPEEMFDSDSLPQIKRRLIDDPFRLAKKGGKKKKGKKKGGKRKRK